MDRTGEVLGSPVPGFGHAPANGNGGNFISFFGLQRNPFNVNPDPRYLFWTPKTIKALADLTSGIETRKSLIVLTGEVGTGKTTLINHLLNSLRQQEFTFAFIFNSHLDIGDLFDFMLADFGINDDSPRQRNVRRTLNDWLFARRRAGDHPILIVDEAQGLSLPVLEEIRMLLNLEADGEQLIQIVLSGQPELDVMLSRPELRQFRQRIQLRCKTAPLTIEETHGCIRQRLQLAGGSPDQIFAPEALDAVYFHSGGTPRVFNLLCEQALMTAYNGRLRPVPHKIVEEVAREFQFDDFKPFPRSLDFGNVSTGDALAVPPDATKSLAAREPAPIELRFTVNPVLNPEPRTTPVATPTPVMPSPAAQKPPPVQAAAAVNPALNPASRTAGVAAPAPPKKLLLPRTPMSLPAIPRFERSFKPNANSVPAKLATSVAFRLGQNLRRIAESLIHWLRQPVRLSHGRRGLLAGGKRP